MQITGVGGSTPWLPSGPTGPRPAAGTTPAATSTAAAATQQSVAAQALQQSQEPHGGGGAGHGKKLNLKPIEDLAARATLQIEPRQKTPAERLAEIERLKRLQQAAAERVGEKKEGEEPDADGQSKQQDGQDEEQPADS